MMNNKFHVTARYLVHDDSAFVHNSQYTLRVWQTVFGAIYVLPCFDGVKHPVMDMKTKYDNLYDFLSHWRLEGIERPFFRREVDN